MCGIDRCRATSNRSVSVFVLRQSQPFGRGDRDERSDFAVVVVVALAQIVDQQGEVQQPLVPQIAISSAHRPRVVEELGGAFHRAQAMFVDRVLVVIVELHKVARMLQSGDELLEHAQFMQLAQQMGQPAGLTQAARGTAGWPARRFRRADAATRHGEWLPTCGVRCASGRDWPGPSAAALPARSLVTLRSPRRVALTWAGPTTEVALHAMAHQRRQGGDQSRRDRALAMKFADTYRTWPDCSKKSRMNRSTGSTPASF